ncbi:hypothetical protein IE53DRAFT_366209 [Violaceomyces palustris]|uniref:Uncharacterized protein n=1 Tax=Violaceomyces palustris TaxID=1673888 RepID=A0ACD0P6H0_9BASI|nr:hypothetical protein IE53DRAFT_366209 [Violaceomyces palustris]
MATQQQAATDVERVIGLRGGGERDLGLGSDPIIARDEDQTKTTRFRFQVDEQPSQDQLQNQPSPPPTPTLGDGESGRDDDLRLFGRILHLTDLHPDPFYLYGTDVDKTSCHGKVKHPKRDGGMTTKTTTTEKDLELLKSQGSGFWGTGVSICDAPQRLIESSLDWISSNFVESTDPLSSSSTGSSNATVSARKRAEQGFDFIIWTGDSARHDIDSNLPRTLDEILQLNRWTLKVLEDHFPGVQIVPSLGNNDIFPHNILFPGPNPITKNFVQIWSDHIPEYEFHTFERGGYFSKEVIPGRLAVMSLNTLYFYDSNKAVDGCAKRKRRDDDDQVDPGTLQLEWLEIQLDMFRQRGLQVHLIGHVPPTPGNYFERCYEVYTDIALRYQDTIVGQHFGHMNVDAFFIQEDLEEGGEKRTGASSDDRLDGLHVKEEDEEDEGVVGTLTLSDDLRQEYSTLPGPARTDEGRYSIYFIAPSIIPTYFPSFRVWTYNTSTVDPYRQKVSRDDDHHSDDHDDLGQPLDSEGDLDQDGEVSARKSRHHHRPPTKKHRKGKKGDKKKKKKKNKKKKKKEGAKKPSHTSPDSPSRRNTFLSLLGYSQWVMDIDSQNVEARKVIEKEGMKKAEKSLKVEYRLEYTTYQHRTLWSEFLPTISDVESRWSDEEGAAANKSINHVPVPKKLLERELRELGLDQPYTPSSSLTAVESIEEAAQKEVKSSVRDQDHDHDHDRDHDNVSDGGKKVKLEKRLRKFTDYGLESIDVGTMLQLGRRLVSDKKLWKRFRRRIYTSSGADE